MAKKTVKKAASAAKSSPNAAPKKAVPSPAALAMERAWLTPAKFM